MTLTSVSVNSTTFQIIAGTADIIAVDVGAAGGPVTLTAKTSSPGAPGTNQTHIVRDTGFASGTDKIVFAPGMSHTIDGAASKDLVTGPGKARQIRYSGGGAWHTIGGEF